MGKTNNTWFKHYNTAHEGQTMANLWAQNKTEQIAFYWTLLEIVSRWEDYDERGKIKLTLAIFRLKLNMKSTRSRRLLNEISDTFGLNLTWISDESFELLVPNWLIFQETRGGKRDAKAEQTPLDVRYKIKDREKIEDVESGADKKNTKTTPDIFGPAIDKLMPLWKKLYLDESWILFSVEKARAHVAAQGGIKTNQIDVWLNSWIAREWAYQKSKGQQKKKSRTMTEILEEEERLQNEQQGI